MGCREPIICYRGRRARGLVTKRHAGRLRLLREILHCRPVKIRAILDSPCFTPAGLTFVGLTFGPHAFYGAAADGRALNPDLASLTQRGIRNALCKGRGTSGQRPKPSVRSLLASAFVGCLKPSAEINEQRIHLGTWHMRISSDRLRYLILTIRK